MKERPILFSTPMVQALLNTKPNVWPAEPIDPGKPFKGMTRRVIKPQPYIIRKAVDPGHIDVWGWEFAKNDGMHWTEVSLSRKQEEICDHAKYQVGDHLWVRETFQAWGRWIPIDRLGVFCMTFQDMTDKEHPYLFAGEFKESPSNKTIIGYYTRPSIFMPRAASRLLLEVKSVRIERVQDITTNDLIAEGIRFRKEDMEEVCIWRDYAPALHKILQKQFKELWNSLNAKRGYSWESNPWVFVYEFMRLE
ncbi:hypothetical protein FACS189447_10840 [Spirochaetia bacterium]|nr:hypothetical protein FACS189447_10840 [Spirochaetia bacterium]